MKRIFICIALAGIFGVAQAAPGNNGGGNGGCGVGQSTNGCGGSAAPVTNQGGQGGVGNGYGGQGGTGVGVGLGYGQGGQGGAGGQGGQGGAGGNGYGGAGGQGGSVFGSGNSANSNTNHNNNTQGQAQGQAQGQQQGQAQSSRNLNDNRSSARNEGNNSSQSVTVEGDHYEAARIPVATAYAAPLAASNGTCMGSSSVGGQGVGFGISIGSTWSDESCDMRYDAEALRLAGMPKAAVARLCQKPEIAAAMETAGTPCPSAKPEAPVTVVVADRTPTAAEKAAGYTGNDPIVRKRLGLPPLK